MDETQRIKAPDYYKLCPLKTENQNLFNSQTLSICIMNTQRK